MFSQPANFYAAWRSAQIAGNVLRDRALPRPPEMLLQAIWHHQRLQRELKTLDGRSVRVLHPGFWNREAGPDFRGCVLQIEGDVHSGDIEIDLQQSGWKAHGHDQKEAYTNVVLHVVWESDSRKSSGMPGLAMKAFLDAPLSELADWVGSDAAQLWPESLRGKCCAPLRDLDSERAVELLKQSAQVRFERKAHGFHIRARAAGWEQTLWEGMFRALGYKHNTWPMQRVAEALPQIAEGRPGLFGLQARLLGLAGLLPGEVPVGTAASDYLRRVWDVWWREREGLSGLILPRRLWRLSGVRPGNHPERRLALASHWLARGDLPAKLQRWFTRSLPDRQLLSSLIEVLQVGTDDFWSWQWTLRSARLAKPQPLLGEKRVTDLAVNVILPWFWMRAVAGSNCELQRRAEERYFAWPAAEDNAVLRVARQRLFGQGKLEFLKHAAGQQGMLQIVTDFCNHSDALCSNCRFPELVRHWF